MTGADHPDDGVAPRAVWLRVLRDYSAVLDEQRANLTALEAGVVVDVASIQAVEFDPPAGMPALPQELRGVAEQLLEQTAGLALIASEVAAGIPPVRKVAAPRVISSRPAALDTLL